MADDKNYRIKPCHYSNGKEDILSLYERGLLNDFQSYVVGNIIKYLVRYPQKNGINDLEKAKEYAKRLKKSLEHESKEEQHVLEYEYRIKMFEDWFKFMKNEYSDFEYNMILNNIKLLVKDYYIKDSFEVLDQLIHNIDSMIEYLSKKEGI